ncbi:MAG: hypothetical protein QMC89_02160 [Candidatus Hodarchaeaceae archaeon]|nr:hypothetical protein [Candidatus Hodarchaeaceae archaeon]
MKHIFVIGEKEKHEIEVDHGWLGKVTVRVDGKIRSSKRLRSLQRGSFCRLKVGEEEKHEAELKFEGLFPKIRCYVDGYPQLREAIIPSRWKKPISLTTILVVCIIVGSISFYGGATWIIREYDKALENLTKEFTILPPYVQIENRNVNIVFKASNGTLHHWTIGVDVLEAQIELGYLRRELIPDLFLPMIEGIYEAYLPLAVLAGISYTEIQEVYASIENLRSLGIQYINLTDNETGENHLVIDFRPFVINNFAEVISNLYHDLGSSDKALVYEIWYIVTQLTTYHSEIKETPRFPLETLIGGGGDCEDLAILIASMLKGVPANYTIKLVYMDADNPTDPKDVNHVIVWVETPSGYKTFVDGTSHTDMCPFTEVIGWYFDV